MKIARILVRAIEIPMCLGYGAAQRQAIAASFFESDGHAGGPNGKHLIRSSRKKIG
jgi:hypothetical protein